MERQSRESSGKRWAKKAADTVGTAVVREGVKHAFKAAVHAIKNDTKWYTHYFNTEGLVGANFCRRKGIFEYRNKLIINSMGTGNTSFPLVATVPVIDLPGRDSSSSWKQGIQYLFTSIRRANTGAANYTSQQVEQYVAAVILIRNWLRIIERGYRCLKLFDAYDATAPIALFKAMGLDYYSFRDNSANIYNDLVHWTTQMQKLAPLKLDLLDRKDFLYSNVFKDSNDVKSSYYVVVPTLQTYFVRSVGWGVDNTLFNGVHQATYLTGSVTGIDYTTLRTRVNDYLRFFTQDNIFDYIAGDMLRAFGASAIYRSTVAKENDTLEPQYDENALTQIQNILGPSYEANFAPTFTVSTGADGYFTCSLNWETTAIDATSNTGMGVKVALEQLAINAPKNKITDGELLEYTRLLFYPVIDDGASGGRFRINCDENGTEVAYGPVIWGVSDKDDAGAANNDIVQLYKNASGIMIVGSSGQSWTFPQYSYITRSTRCWSGMDWAPRMLIMSLFQASGVDNIGMAVDCWDCNNYAILTKENMDTYHGWAVLSLLYVPMKYKETRVTELK